MELLTVSDFKVCNRCGQEKSVTEFYRRSGTRHGLQPWCRQCSSDVGKKYYADHRAERRYSVKYARRRTKIVGRKEAAVAYKGGCCTRCGYDRYVGALEFHHLDPMEKEWQLGSRLPNGRWESLKAELDKCVLVCSNCHKEIHYELRKGGESGVTYSRGV